MTQKKRWRDPTLTVLTEAGARARSRAMLATRLGPGPGEPETAAEPRSAPGRPGAPPPPREHG